MQKRVLGLGVICLLGAAGLLGVWIWQQTPQKSVGESSALPTPTASISPWLSPDGVPALTLEQIISGTASVEASRLDPAQLTTLVATGDIIPARSVDVKVRRHGPDYPFAGKGIAELLRGGDLTIVDLEAPLIAACPEHRDGFVFCGQPSFAQAMKRAGIDVATLENNHIENYGQQGRRESVEHLAAAGVDYASSSHLAISTVKDKKIGVLAFNGIGRTFDTEGMAAQVALARPQVDILLVAVHWGKEYELLPIRDGSIAPDDPRSIGKLLIESGADMVIGNHPHWVQGVELYQNKLITYAHGNFIFDQSWSAETMQGVVGKYTFYGTKLIKVEFVPVHIYDQSQPAIVSGHEAETILGRLVDSTRQLAETSLAK